MSKLLLENANEIKDYIIKVRRDLHQIPELGIHLPETVAYIEKELDQLGVEYTTLKDSSNIIATLGQGDKCILIRGDIDGLPGDELSELDFAATNGHMHACGHDMHGASLLGAVKLLKEKEDQLEGVVKVLFQSGEETFQGARAAIEGGVMENPKVDMALSQHVFAGMPLGEFYYGDIPMAGVYGFKITVTGVGVHGSSPELGVDPINTAVQIYQGFQELMAREISGFDRAALTIGKFSGGHTANVIPQTVEMQGTLRAFDGELRETLIQRITDLSENIAKAYRSTVEIEVINDVPPLVTNEKMQETMVEVIKSMDESFQVHDGFHAMGSEDFSLFASLVPSAHFIIGAGFEDESKNLAQHNPKIIFNEDALAIAAAYYVEGSIQLLKTDLDA